MKKRLLGEQHRSLREKSSSVSDFEELPMVHVTSAGAAYDILRSGKIVPNQCTVFEKNLCYFFVSRPDYRHKTWSEKQEYISYFPVAFIFRREFPINVYHVYPFDTGAAHLGLFDERADPHTWSAP
jgi:hypothetical protein